MVYAEITVQGLCGGHSALDINLGREMRMCCFARVILALSNKYDCHLCSFKGGTAVTQIPREASATVIIREDRRRGIVHGREASRVRPQK